MKFPKPVLIISLVCVLAVPALARTWTNKDGKKIEADFVKYDTESNRVTIQSGNEEQTFALGDFSENDQKWVADHVAGLAEGKNPKAAEEADKKEEIKFPDDKIFLLLDKTPAEVAAALKTLKMVEDIDSVVIRNRENLDGEIVRIQHIYDDGKVIFAYAGEKLQTIDIDLNNGYKGVMPMGLKKDMTQKEATEILKKQDFNLVDWGTSPPGWGLAHRLNSLPHKVVAIMTLEAQSPELAVIRIMNRE